MAEAIAPFELSLAEKFRQWEKDLDPSILEAHEAFLRVSKKPFRILDIAVEAEKKDGIYVLPRHKDLELLRIGQRRGIKDLFTRGSSAHNVAFGIAEVRNGSGPRLIHVAIKPFDKGYQALQEARVNAIILERGFTTTDPLCVIVDNSEGFMITPVREGVQALDTEPWHQFKTGSEEIRAHFISRLKAVAEVAANLNSRGINHADGALRNYWLYPLTGIEGFDWESASFTDDPPAPEKLITFGVGTLRPLFKSLDREDPAEPNIQTVSILRGPAEARWNSFNTLIFEPYIDQLFDNLHSRGLLNDEYLQAITSIEYTLKDKLNLKD